MLSNLALKKLDKEYANEMFDLLYRSKNLTENYSEKRKNLNKEIEDKKNLDKNMNNDNNGIYITLPKVEDIKSNIVLPNILNNSTNENNDYKINN